MRSMCFGLPAALCVFCLVAGAWSDAWGTDTPLLADAFGPCWSPSGDSLVCSHCVLPCGDDDWQIWTVPLGSGEPDTLIVDPLGAYFPMWLPDGRTFVYFRVQDTPSPYRQEFVVYDRVSGPLGVWEVEHVWDDPGFNLSPDGSEVLFTRSAGANHETWAVNLSSGSERFVHEGYGGVISPDGLWIAFTTDEDSLCVALINGPAVNLRETGWLARWTPDSRYLVFTGFGVAGQRDLIAISRDGTYRQQITNDAEWEWYCAVSPAGDRVACTKTIGEFGQPVLWVLDLNINPIPTKEVSWGRVKSLFR